MLLKGKPNQVLSTMIIGVGGKKKIVNVCKFDEKGYAEVDEKRLSQTTLTKLKPYITEDKVVKATEKVKEVKKEAVKLFKCKKCDFVTENKGLLLKHYRDAHPKK